MLSDTIHSIVNTANDRLLVIEKNDGPDSGRPKLKDDISDIINKDSAVMTLLLTMHMPSNDILLAIDVEFPKEIATEELARVIK